MDSVKRELKSRMDKLEAILKDQKNLRDQMETREILKEQMEMIMKDQKSLKDQMEKSLKLQSNQMEKSLKDQMEKATKTILGVQSQSTEAVH
jgi:hypothetical protein